MDAGLGSWAANHADGLARALAGAGVGLGALAAHRQAAQVADAAVAFDALHPLQVHTNLAAQIAFNDIFAVLDCVDDLGELLLGQVLRTDPRIDLSLGQDVYGIAGANAINVAQCDIDALVRGHFYADDTSHTLKIG